MKNKIRKILLSTILTLSPIAILASCGGNNEEVPNETITKKFSVTSSFDKAKGSVTLSKTSGNVGDKVTATITANEGFECTEIKFNNKTLTVASTIELTPVEGTNTLAVTFTEVAQDIVLKSLTVTGLAKTNYLVGDALDLTGLKVKLVTTKNGVLESEVDYTNFDTSIKSGYVFEEKDITPEGLPLELNISAKDPDIMGTTIELTVSAKPIEGIKFTPADFFAKMKSVGKYKIDNGEEVGTFIKDALYWEANPSSSYESYGFAQSDNKIIIYTIQQDTLIEKEKFDRIGKEPYTYTTMFDDSFAERLRDSEFPYFIQGAEFMTDAEIENYRKTIKPSRDNPNIYNVQIPNDTNSMYARDILAMTFNGQLPLNDYGVKFSYGPNARIQLKIVDEKTMELKVLGSSSTGHYPLQATFTIDETLTIPAVEPFLNGTISEDPDKDKTLVALDALKANNFTSSLGDTFTKDYTFRQTTSEAFYNKAAEFSYEGQKFVAGNYTTKFDAAGKPVKDATTDSAINGIDVSAYPIVGTNPVLTDWQSFFPFYNEADNELILTHYIESGSVDFYTNIPNLYNALFGVDLVKNVPDAKQFRTLEFKVYFTDKTCTKVDRMVARFIVDPTKNETITLNNFGTSKVDFVDTFIKSLI